MSVQVIESQLYFSIQTGLKVAQLESNLPLLFLVVNGKQNRNKHLSPLFSLPKDSSAFTKQSTVNFFTFPPA